MSSKPPDDKPNLEVPRCTFEEFFLSAPPGSWRAVQTVWQPVGKGEGLPGEVVTVFPELKLNCSSEKCGGPSWFKPVRTYSNHLLRIASGSEKAQFVHYICKSCEDTQKAYALFFVFNSPDDFGAYKFGELPRYGPPLPARVLRLFQSDVELFKKARNAENLGFGIAAFAYYRRIVENHKNELFDKIIAIAEEEHLATEKVEALRQAQEHTQFTQSMEAIKEAIPESLKIAGHNPLVLLHAAFSKGVHELSDEECLEKAQSVRTVLIALAERFALIRAEDKELKQALSTLLRPESK
jgi:hypothetical protein